MDAMGHMVPPDAAIRIFGPVRGWLLGHTGALVLGVHADCPLLRRVRGSVDDTVGRVGTPGQCREGVKEPM